ncbi:MAG: hypothetical protein MHM6MM_006546 [Cercozoa sp. M6MM]
MVFYFRLSDDEIADDFRVYMGDDKHENEKLIRWGFPEDVWFHVDDLSSAHVYLRMPRGTSIDDLPESVLEEMCQLVKHNSIKGSKMKECSICFTPWSNLRKGADMDIGTIGFHDESLVRHRRCMKDRVAIRRIERTRKQEHDVDFEAMRADRDASVAAERRQARKAEINARKAAREERKRLKRQQQYDFAFEDEAVMTSNRDMAMTAEEFEDSFM